MQSVRFYNLINFIFPIIFINQTQCTVYTEKISFSNTFATASDYNVENEFVPKAELQYYRT